ncbi:MAG: amino acid adenylation domain-containing protein, partial [Gemmatimonadaceae bacterium]
MISRPDALDAPLSFEQEWLWLLDNAMPGLTAYNVPRALRVTGVLDTDALQRALSLIVERHATLRTTFKSGINANPVQVVAPAGMVPIALEDLSHLAGDEQDARVHARVRELAQRSIDLANDPMLFATVLRLNENEHVLSLLTHHIVSDGGSRDILFRELVEAYAAFQRGETPKLPALPMQYAEFSANQRERLQGAPLTETVDHWRKLLAGAPAALEMPTDRPRTGVVAFAGSQHSISLPAAFATELNGVAQKLGMTLNMLMLAVFQSLLHRYTGQEDIVVGCPVSQRDEPVDDLIGFFANVLPFRVSFAGDPSFEELAARVSDVCMDVYEHAEMPLEPLMRALQRDGRSAQAPLFQAMMVFEYEGGALPQLGTAKLEVIAHEHETVATDIALVVRVGATGITLALQYRTDLFDSETVEPMLGHLRILLESATRNPETLVSRLPLLGHEERVLVTTTFNDTEAPYPSGRATHDLIIEQAAKTPDNLAVICGSTRMTYRELHERSNGLAAKLIELGVTPNSMVGVTAERTAETVVSIIGILKTGACYVPLDPANPAERIALIAADAELTIVVGRDGSLPALSGAPGITMIPPGDTLPFDEKKHRVTVGGDSLAYIIYTSGSTGKPKGVLVTHENLIGSTWARVIRYPAIVDRYLMLSPFAFDSSVAGLYWTLIQGGALVVPEEGSHLDAVGLCKLMRDERVSHVLAMPSLLHEVLKEASPKDVEALRVTMTGGDWCSEELLQRHRDVAPLAGFYNEYGPTEATVWCSVLGIEPDEPLPRITIGQPTPNGRMYVLDARGEVMPIGIPGEIYIGGVGVTPGYLRRPALTNALFVADPFAPRSSAHQMMYKTGERGRWLANGQLDFLGRVDHQVKVNGYRIELGEVESALLREPRVKDAAVLVQGTGTERRLVGYVAVGEGGSREPRVQAELRQFLRRMLPEYMVPATIILLEKFALNANGKVDRHALPVPDAIASGPAYVAPANAVEETIAGIMADILSVPRVGAHDDFFALGGSSLVAMRLMARLSRALDVRLTWAMLFEASTVSALGARVRRLLDSNGPAARDEPIPALPGDTAPLSFAQELLWLLDRATPGLNAYNVPMAFRINGTLDSSALESALSALVARHGPLRTTFNADNSALGVTQRVGAPVRVPVAHVDLRNVAASRREEALTQRARDAIRAPFDITRETLLRATVYRLDENASCLLLVSHHIVFDEVSSYVVLRELSALYTEQMVGTLANLPPLPIRYGDYAAWQRESVERGALVHQLAYWRERLRDLPVLELPTIGPRPVAPRFEGARRRYDIPESLLERIRKVSAKHDVTLYMTLLATLKALLHRYSGQDDIVVGAPITTRSREELEGLVGYFPNVLVLRTQLDGDPTFADLLARVRATCVGGFAHQDVPQEKLALELRDAGRSASDPFIQVLCVLESKTAETQTFGGFELRRMAVDFGTSKFDITVAMRETHDGLGVVLEYRTDLFDEGTMDRLFGHLQVLLEAVATNADRRVSDVPLLTTSEHQQMVYDWNATERAYPANATLNELIETQVARAPNAPAVADARESLTYAELDARANQLAHNLRALGVTRGQLVGVAAERSVAMVVGLVAIVKAGGAYVPVDPEYPADRVAFMLEDSGVRVLLTQKRLADSLPGNATVVLLDDPATFAGQPTTAPERVHDAADAAYMIYTSGSTGRPKGALNAHSGIVNRLLWMQDEYHLTAADVVLQKTPFSFDVSVWEFFWPLITGAQLYMADPGGHRDTGYLADIIGARKITVCHFVPSMLRAFLANAASAKCASLREVMASGEALAPDLVAVFYATLPSTRLHNLYGPTECAVDVSFWPCPPSPLAPASIPIGRPVANTQLYVLDRLMQPVPIGVPGELYLAGRQVGLGYHGRADLTAERFVRDPFAKADGARMYRTGDRARWRPDGNVEYLGRLDFQVKVRGFRIELGEIETTLARHAEVQDVAVMAHDDGSGDARLIAYVVPNTESSGLATDEGVDRWREVFDRTYTHAEETGDAVESGFNIAGWLSSYDKRPIPAPEMREWVDRTCDRILERKPKRVLEIGCGTGLLLFRIAPHV